jgi:hypothetical protein
LHLRVIKSEAKRGVAGFPVMRAAIDNLRDKDIAITMTRFDVTSNEITNLYFVFHYTGIH